MSRTTLVCSILGVVAAALGLASAALAEEKEKPTPAASSARTVYEFEVTTIDGKKVKLDQYKGDVLLIVNVASECGLTDANYKMLEPLYRKYKDQGFRVLAFPANNFGAQEPKAEAEIKQFCTSKYDVTFDLFSKVSVAGDDTCALYKYLTGETAESYRGPIKWNFQKYLVNRKGEVVDRFMPARDTNESQISKRIEEELAVPRPASKE